MRREANTEAVYPPVLPAATNTAANRISRHLVERFGLADNGSLGAVDDPFYADVQTLLAQAQHAIFTLQVMKKGSFSSTDTEPKYAGGGAGEGSRIYTPAEAAANTLEDIRIIENR